MSDFASEVEALANALQSRGAMVASAESCTGGMIAAACTDRAGSSAWFERGFVTYSNAAKSEMLGIDRGRIAAHGAVSAEVARAMVEGALVHSEATWAVAVTGIAGPAGATPGKPVGTVWLAIGRRGGAPALQLLQLVGDRAAIRAQTVLAALQRLREAIERGP